MIEQTTPRHFQCMQKTYYLKYSKTTYTCSFLIQQQSTWEMHSYCLYMWVTVVNEIDGPNNPHNAVKRKKKTQWQRVVILKVKDLLSHAFQPLPFSATVFAPPSVICDCKCFLHRRKFLPPQDPICSVGLNAVKRNPNKIKQNPSIRNYFK